MKFVLLILTTFSISLSASDYNEWADRVSKSSFHALLEFAASQENESKALKEFHNTKETAGPFAFPVTDIKNVQGNKVRVEDLELEFTSIKPKEKNGYYAVRFYKNLENRSHALIKVNGGGDYQVYLNGRYLDQRGSGLIFEQGSTHSLVSLEKGKNEFIVLVQKSKSFNSGLSVIPVDKGIMDKFKTYLIEKFATLNDENKNEFINTLDRICYSGNTGLIATGSAHLINKFKMGKDDWGYHNLMRKALSPDVVAALVKKVDEKALVEILLRIDLHNMHYRLTELILNERTKPVEGILLTALEQCKTDKMIEEFRRNLYESATMLSYCGRYQSANRLLGKYRTIMNVKDSNHFKEVEALFIETSDPGKVRPRFVGDPETDHLKREVDSLLSEKPGKEAYLRLLRLFRNKGHQLFEDSDRKLSLQGYLANSLKNKPVYAKGFAEYIKGRYQDDVQKAISNSNPGEVEKIISEVEGLAEFPQARKYLMQEFFNRGQIRKSLRDACYLLKYGVDTSLAASYILILEDRLAIPQNSRVVLPEEVFSAKVKIAGNEVKISDLVNKYRTKSFKVTPKGPGQLVSQFELAELSYGSYEATVSDRRKGTFKLLRQPVNSIFYKDRWISASPYGIRVFDKSGKPLWRVKKPIKDVAAQEVSIPKSYSSVILENNLYNLEFAEGSSHLELVARDLDGNEIWSTQTLKGYEKWEPCSLPFSKFNTAVLLLMEKQRTTSPVMAVGFIDLQSGNLSKIIPVSRIRDPFNRDRRYTDISNIARFHDRFTSDAQSIYFYTGSGQIIKIDALNENISWVAGYHFRLAGRGYHHRMTLSRAVAAAPGFITKSDNFIVNFNPSRLGWFIINEEDGTVVWKNFTSIPNYIHSRGTSEVIYSTGSEDRRSILIRMDPKTGKKIWKRDLLGIRVSGEGTVSNGLLYIPTLQGIAEVNLETGNLQKISPVNETPYKIDRINDDWLIQTRYNGFVFKSGDKITSSIKDNQQPQTLSKINYDERDKRFWSFETAVEFPFNFSGKDHDELRQIFKTSLPGHYIIRIGNDVALFRESTYENKKYMPPKVIWSNSLNDFDVHGDYLLIRQEDRIEVLNILTRKNEFVYEYTPTIADLLSNRSELLAARMDKEKIYILNGKQQLMQFGLKNGNLIHSYRLSASDFIVEGNQLLAFTSKQGKYKTRLFDINGKLTEIKTFDDKISDPSLFKSNDKYIGWFSGDKLYVFNKQTKEISNYNCSRKTGWNLMADFAAVSPGYFINLNNKNMKKVSAVYLCENGGAIILENKKDLLYLSDKGQLKLENVDDKFKFPNEDPLREIRDYGRGLDYGDQLVLTSFEGDRIYSLKDGKLISFRAWSHSDRNREFLFTEKSKLVLKHDKAYIFSNLGHELPVSRLKESEEEVDYLNWVPLDRKSWINTGSSNAPEAHYRLSDTPDNFVLQVRLKNSLQSRNSVSVSMTSQYSEDYVYAEAVEGRSTFINNSGSLSSDEGENHYFDADGNEYFIITLGKDQKLTSGHRPFVHFEIATLKNNDQTGFYRVGGSFAPGATYLNLNGEQPQENFTKGRFTELEELYQKTSCLLADGRSLSKFIKARRSIKGVDDNIRFLEGLLKKHYENVSGIGVLTVLFLEKIQKVKDSGKYNDQTLIETSRQCRSFASSIKMQNDWITYALTAYELDIIKDLNHRSLPYSAGLKGEGEVFISLDGSLQVSAQDGKVLLMPGLFYHSTPFKIREIEFRYNSLPPVLGEIKLLQDEKITVISNIEGDPQNGMVHSRWNEKTQKVLAFTEKGTFPAFTLTNDPRLYLKEIQLARIEHKYKWDAPSLLENMKLNPVSEWQATDMLRKWLEINKVSDDKLHDILVEVMSYNPNNYNLIHSVCNVFMEKYKDLDKVKSILRQAKIQINFRRSIFMSFVKMDNWQLLGPIYAAEDIKVPKFEPSPERVRPGSDTEFTDTNGNKFKFKPDDNSKSKANSGLVYYRTEFDSKITGKTYLHLKNDGHQGYGHFTVWANGKLVYEGSFQRWKRNLDAILIECRQGKNSILIKYDFIKNKNFQAGFGDLYGAPVSYITNSK